MPNHQRHLNRVKEHRLAQSQSQAELAKAAGISRAGLSAIEVHRLIPSVATALGLARALKTSVESLFGRQLSTEEPVWSHLPKHIPSRFWAADVAGRVVLYPVEATGGLAIRQDGTSENAATASISGDSVRRTLVIATCDPAAAHLAQEYARQTPFRMIVLHRSSREAMQMLDRGLIHVAGIHLAESKSGTGNQGAVKDAGIKMDVQLLAVAGWNEGVALGPAVKLRSVKQAAATRLRWIGRGAGAGARRCQNEVLGSRRAPRHVAVDHFDVVASIRSGFADAGVCVRLVAEEAHINFLPVCEDDYDLCFPRNYADDPRVTALIEVVRSFPYRAILAELPGYRTRSAELSPIIKRST